MQTTSHLNPLKFETKEGIEGATKALGALGSAGNGDVFLPTEAITNGIAIGNGIVQFAKIALTVLARGIIVPGELALRHGFGERYFSQFQTIVFVASVIGASVMNLIGWPITLVVLIGGIFLLCKSSWVCFRRDRAGLYWHSYFEGESRLRVPAVDAFLHQWFFSIDFSKLVLEPAIVLGIGISLQIPASVLRYSSASQFVGYMPILYFGPVAIAMFGYQFYCYKLRREATLNEKDAQIVAEAKLAAIQPDQEPKMKIHRGVAYLPPVKLNSWQGSVNKEAATAEVSS